MPGTPVVFNHGLFIHSASWTPWMDLFTEHGYHPSAPGWPGDAPTVADYLDTLDSKPIVIGHSFGGLIAQELLANNLAVAAVTIDPAPIKGVKTLPFSQLRSGSPCWVIPRTRSEQCH